MRAATLSLALLACLLAAAPAGALQQTLVALDGQADDYLGWDVAVDGDVAVVGATQNFNTANGPGYAYVFQRTGDTWAQTARLEGSDSQAGDGFGQNVAIEGDTIVVGSPRHIIGQNFGAGAVYTFDRYGPAVRTETAKLTIQSPAMNGAGLGSGVAIDGDVIAASAPGDSTTGTLSHGAVYLFDRTGAAVRHEKARLLASDRSAGQQLGEGWSLAIGGETIVAGAWRTPGSGMNLNRGVVYTFDANATGTATETDTLLAPDGAGLDQFGFSVDIDGETIVVGANKDSFSVDSSRRYIGSAYTFEATGEHRFTSKLVSSDGISEDRFGWGVAVGGGEIAVAADLDDHGASTTTNEGSVYLFPRSSPDAERTEQSILRSPSPERANYFGSALDRDGNTMIVGERSDDVGEANSNRGSATIYFDPATTPACSDGGDNDGDGLIDFPADPGCTSPDDTSEANLPPGTSPTPTATPTPGGGGIGGPPPGTDEEPLPPRIVRPRTEKPVVVKKRILKLFTIWDCVPEPDGSPCKGRTKIVIGRFVDEDGQRRATVAKKKKPKVIGGGVYTVASGAKKRVTAKLSKKGEKLLRKRKKLKVTVVATLNRAGVETISTAIPVKLKAPKRSG